MIDVLHFIVFLGVFVLILILSKVSSMWLIGSDISREVIIRKARSCTIVGDVHWECHVPCKLKTTSVYFDREYALWPLQMAKLFAHSQLYVLFQWLSKVIGPAATFLSHSVCFAHCRHGYTWNACHWTLNNKSIYILFAMIRTWPSKRLTVITILSFVIVDWNYSGN